MYRALLPAMIQVIGQCVETNNDVGARHLFDVLETLLILVRNVSAIWPVLTHTLQEVPILSKSIPDLIEFLLRCGATTSFDQDLRILALNALNWTVQ